MKLYILAGLFLLNSLTAQSFKTVSVDYTLNGKQMSNHIMIPQYENDELRPIRGVMEYVSGPLKEFAHKNQVAMFQLLDEDRGISQEFLTAAAKVTNRPEIQFAGAIVQGTSAKGRRAAFWASENRHRAIAVILDHSFCWGIGTPVTVKGVPMYFNATYHNLFQNHDRRKLQSQWCKAGFAKRQACTAIVDFVKNGGHGGRGTTTLTAVWLEEAMNFRVPLNIPVGKPYQLIDVDPMKCGGYVSMKISMEGTRSYHDKVKVTLKSNGADWWIPGPKSTALYLDWVRKNGGSIEKDESAGIQNSPQFINLPTAQKRILDLIKAGRWNQAFTFIQQSKTPEDPIDKMFSKMISDNIESHLTLLEQFEQSGDIYSLYMNIKNDSRLYKGIRAYDSKFNYYLSLFKKKETALKLKLCREFHSIIDRLNKSRKLTVFNLGPLKSFAQKHADNKYGQVAQKAFDRLSADLSLKLTPDKYFEEE
ncbi:MAG: hypothetical protein MK132_25855 [Lentisphaerales bacterium]|nr:hypothetical protein [Lentisphaerales bacterium]